jgi:hypothetical protein
MMQQEVDQDLLCIASPREGKSLSNRGERERVIYRYETCYALLV